MAAPLRPQSLQAHAWIASPMALAWFLRSDALAACRAPTCLPILVIFLISVYWTFLRLIIALSWGLRAGMRSIRPKGQMLKASFTVYYVFAVAGTQAAGAAFTSWLATSSALCHRGPDGQAGVPSSSARMMMILAARRAGCLKGPMARAPVRRLLLRSSSRRVDGASGCRAARRPTACPSPSTSDVPLVSHRNPPRTCRCTTRLPARGAGRRDWVTALAKASSQKEMKPGRRKGRRMKGPGGSTPIGSMRRMRHTRRRAYVQKGAEVGVTEVYLAPGFAVTSTSGRP